MMDNSSLKTSSHNGNGNGNGNNHNGNRIYLTPSLQPEFLPRLEEQENDWNLRQVLGIAKRRSLVMAGVMVAVMTAVVGLTLNQKPLYEAKFQILAEPVNKDDTSLPKFTATKENNFFSKSSLDYETQIQVLKSPELMANIVKQLQVSYPDINYNSLVNSLSITRLGETKIIEVRYLNNDPVKIKVVLDELFVKDHSQYESSKFLEALRVLHTNIQLLSSDEPIRSIVISSATPAEGKSTIAFHLAQTAAAMGQRVLLVDADLRRPRIHSLSNLNNLWGLSSIISGSMPVETAIRQMPSMSELSVITAGPIPPDPTKLLSSQKMKQLITDFHSSFDLVIYDAPPLVGLADASLLASHTDGIVLVARMHKTDRSMLAQALDSLKMTRSNILGMVLNWHKSNGLGYYNYY